MKATGVRLLILGVALVGLLFGQQAMASSYVPLCEPLCEDCGGCMDGGCCVPFPGACPNQCQRPGGTSGPCECLPV